MTARIDARNVKVLWTLLAFFLTLVYARDALAVEFVTKGWEFRWGDSPRSSAVPQWTLDSTSDGWQKADVTRPIPGRGSQNFLWLRLRLPAIPSDDPHLYFPMVDTQFETYLRGKLLFRTADLSSKSELRFSGHGMNFINLQDAAEGEFLYLRIHSFHTNIGILREPFLGSRAEIQNFLYREEFSRVAVGTVLFGMGLITLAIGLWTRNPSYTVFALLALSSGVYSFCRTRLASNLMFPSPYAASYVELVSLYIIPIGYALFAYLTFMRTVILRSLVWIFLAYAIGSIVFIAAGGDLLATLPPYQVIAVAGIFLVLGLSFRQARKNDLEAILFSTGLGLSLIFNFFDILSAARIIPGLQSFMHWGLLCLMLCLGMILIHRYRSVLEQLRQYSEELHEEHEQRVAELRRQQETERSALMKVIGIAARVSDRLNSPLLVLVNSLELLSKEIDEHAKRPDDHKGNRRDQVWMSMRPKLDSSLKELMSLSRELSELRENKENLEATNALKGPF